MASSIVITVFAIITVAWGASVFWVIGLRPDVVVRSRARGKVLSAVYLAILLSFYAIPLQLLFGTSATRSDRLYGTWIGLAIILPMYAAAIAIGVVIHR